MLIMLCDIKDYLSWFLSVTSMKLSMMARLETRRLAALLGSKHLWWSCFFT